jgi:hypothetical protein
VVYHSENPQAFTLFPFYVFVIYAAVSRDANPTYNDSHLSNIIYYRLCKLLKHNFISPTIVYIDIFESILLLLHVSKN